jgi:hypothetical protein
MLGPEREDPAPFRYLGPCGVAEDEGHGVLLDARVAQQAANGSGQLPSVLVVQPADGDLDTGELFGWHGFLAVDENRLRVHEDDLHQVDWLPRTGDCCADLLGQVLAGLLVERSGGDLERRHAVDPMARFWQAQCLAQVAGVDRD